MPLSLLARHAEARSRRRDKRSAYHVLSRIGRGGFCSVYKALHIATRELVAVKKVDRRGETNGLPESAIREVGLLRQLRQHPSIVQFRSIINTADEVWIVLELMDSNLRTFTAQHPRHLPKFMQSFSRQLMRGVSWCHAHRIVHRDLKPDNLLIKLQRPVPVLKITDFGLARAFNQADPCYTVRVVTVYYRAPELLLGLPSYTAAVDMWSVGCIIAEMARTGSVLFARQGEYPLLEAIFRLIGLPDNQTWPAFSTLPETNSFNTFMRRRLSAEPLVPSGDGLFSETLNNFDDDGIRLVKILLSLNPSDRTSAKEALRHAYLRAT